MDSTSISLAMLNARIWSFKQRYPSVSVPAHLRAVIDHELDVPVASLPKDSGVVVERGDGVTSCSEGDGEGNYGMFA
jgi:hypothetical protein